MTHVTCRLTAKNGDRLQDPTLGNRVWATFTIFSCWSNCHHPWLKISAICRSYATWAPCFLSTSLFEAQNGTILDRVFRSVSQVVIFFLSFEWECCFLNPWLLMLLAACGFVAVAGTSDLSCADSRRTACISPACGGLGRCTGGRISIGRLSGEGRPSIGELAYRGRFLRPRTPLRRRAMFLYDWKPVNAQLIFLPVGQISPRVRDSVWLLPSVVHFYSFLLRVRESWGIKLHATVGISALSCVCDTICGPHKIRRSRLLTSARVLKESYCTRERIFVMHVTTALGILCTVSCFRRSRILSMPLHLIEGSASRSQSIQPFCRAPRCAAHRQTDYAITFLAIARI